MKLIAPHKKIRTPTDNKAVATGSLADEDRITPNGLNLEDISNLQKFDANYIHWDVEGRLVF